MFQIMTAAEAARFIEDHAVIGLNSCMERVRVIWATAGTIAIRKRRADTLCFFMGICFKCFREGNGSHPCRNPIVHARRCC